jgi:hypothetical protein
MSESPHPSEPDRGDPMSEYQEELARVPAAFRRLGCRWWCTCLVTCVFLIGGLGMILVYRVLPAFGVIVPSWVKYLSGGVVLASSVPLIVLSWRLPKIGKER